MRFLSLFSGIEAASCAWLPLGWECAAVSEIEPFPCAVLKHYYPDVPNLGDVTKITREQVEALGHIDLLVGGFPCQDLSVAGKRAGLRNDDGSATRSGLFFAGMQIADWSKAQRVLVENVPGIFSSNKGRDFAAVVGEMAGCGFNVPRNGWENAGVVVGPRGLVEWATLDAQYFGVAQRRRRVFIIRDSGDWTRRPPIFFERHSLQGHSAPRRETRQDIAPCLDVRAGRSGETTFHTSGGLIPIATRDICPALKAHDAKGVSSDGDGDGAILIPMAYGIAANIINRNAKNGGNGFGVKSEIGYTLTKNDRHAVAYRTAGDGAAYCEGDKTAPMTTGTDPSANIIVGAMRVRRLTPRECERLQGFPSMREIVRIDACFDHQNGSVDVALSCLRWPSNASRADAEKFLPHAGSAAAALSTSLALREPLAALHARLGSEAELLELRSHGKSIWSANSAGASGSFPLSMRPASIADAVAKPSQCLGLEMRAGRAESLQCIRLSIPAPCGERSALTSGAAIEVCANGAGSGAKLARFTTSNLGQLHPTCDSQTAIWLCSVLAVISGCIPSETLPDSFSFEIDVEADYTDIYTSRKKGTPDEPRYKVLGNSMAVPVIRWLGERIQQVNAIQPTQKAE